MTPPGVVSCPADWWDCDWKARIELTPDDGQLDALTGFPVLVVLTPQRVDYDRVSKGGANLQFVSSAGDVLPHELESWDPEGSSAVWVRANLGMGETIELYFDGPDAGGGSPEDVWEGYAGVWHMAGASPLDSSPSGNDGTTDGVSGAAGIVAGATAFDGNMGYMQMGSDASVDDIFDGGGTVTIWINAEGPGVGGFPRLLDKSIGGNGGNGFRFALTEVAMGSARLRLTRDFATSGGAWNSTNAVVDLDAWHHIALVYDDSGNEPPSMYVDGQSVSVTTGSSPAGAATSDENNDLFIGNGSGNDRTFEGRLDEVRVIASSRSDAWIEAESLAGRDMLLEYGPIESL